MRTGNKTGLRLALWILLAVGIAGCGSRIEPSSASIEENMISSLKSAWEYEKWPRRPELSGRLVARSLRLRSFASLGKIGTGKNFGRRINFQIYDPGLGVSVGSVSIEVGRSFNTACNSLITRCAPQTTTWLAALTFANGKENLRAGDVALVLPRRQRDSSYIERMIFIRNNVAVGICNFGKSPNFDTVKIARKIDSTLVDLIRQRSS